MPEDRNIYGKIFGGYLMRAAYEVAWSCGWRAMGVVPTFLALDAVTFRAPVDVGTLLRLDAQVAFAEGNRLTVTVDATMSVPGRAGPYETPTNQFSFVFETPPEEVEVEGEGEGEGEGEKGGGEVGIGGGVARSTARSFVPRSYAEGLSLLAARRRTLAHTPELELEQSSSRFPREWWS